MLVINVLHGHTKVPHHAAKLAIKLPLLLSDTRKPANNYTTLLFTRTTSGLRCRVNLQSSLIGDRTAGD